MLRARPRPAKRWIGPSPGASAMASLSVSRRPIRQKYSGSATSCAPAAAASAIRRSAAARLRVHVGRGHHLHGGDLHGWGPHCSGGLTAPRGRRPRPSMPAGASPACARRARTLRVGPGAGDVELARAGRDQRLAQQPLRQEGAQADRRVDGRIGQRRGAGVDLGHHHARAGPASRARGRPGLPSAPRPARRACAGCWCWATPRAMLTSPSMLSKAKPSWNRSRKSSDSRRGSACRLSTPSSRAAPGSALRNWPARASSRSCPSRLG